ncbi:hypothetical protein Ssi02_59630 [Sinosporangium siamense]|uniref:Uncharacterized protein n=1 Tax=Sinosporangium siamense TaxID=1367973 RepID=A0A919VAS9_9ACTN|nr:hypothetical protein Ssi02_59630 [Sinosporangium siamense]
MTAFTGSGAPAFAAALLAATMLAATVLVATVLVATVLVATALVATVLAATMGDTINTAIAGTARRLMERLSLSSGGGGKGEA